MWYLRIAMLHWAFPPTIGGVETHLAMLCPALVREGCAVALLTGAVDGRVAEETWEGVRIRRTPLMDLNSLSPTLIRRFKDEIREELARFIDRERPDIIHAHNMHYFSYIHAEALVRIKERMDVPLILSAHNVWDDETWEELLQLRFAWDGVIAVSHYIKRELVVSGYPAGQIRVIHHGLDLARFQAATPPETVRHEIREKARGRKIVFHPARMSLAKGSDIVVLAFKRVKEVYPDAFLLLAGTNNTVDWGSYRQGEIAQIRRMIAECGLEEDVLIRFFPWEEMPAAYGESEVVVYPSSFDEPFGLVLLEAMAAGKPLVVTRAGGMPEIVVPGETGFIIPRRQPDALAEKILALLRAPDLAHQMGQRARQRVAERFTLERMVRETVAYYEEVCRTRGRAERGKRSSAVG
ncbi:glycosyltransferase family 4 protein [Thermodesulfitimonas sp.]